MSPISIAQEAVLCAPNIASLLFVYCRSKQQRYGRHRNTWNPPAHNPEVLYSYYTVPCWMLARSPNIPGHLGRRIKSMGMVLDIALKPRGRTPSPVHLESSSSQCWRHFDSTAFAQASKVEDGKDGRKDLCRPNVSSLVRLASRLLRVPFQNPLRRSGVHIA